MSQRAIGSALTQRSPCSARSRKEMGDQAQFNHPDPGGLGQWSQGGMIMVGDMFNQGLKYRVDALCNELAGLLRSQPLAEAEAGAFRRKARATTGESVGSSRERDRLANGGPRNWVARPQPAPRMICDTPAFLARADLRFNRAGRSASMTPASIGSRNSPNSRAAISR